MEEGEESERVSLCFANMSRPSSAKRPVLNLSNEMHLETSFANSMDNARVKKELTKNSRIFSRAFIGNLQSCHFQLLTLDSWYHRGGHDSKQMRKLRKVSAMMQQKSASLLPLLMRARVTANESNILKSEEVQTLLQMHPTQTESIRNFSQKHCYSSWLQEWLQLYHKIYSARNLYVGAEHILSTIAKIVCISLFYGLWQNKNQVDTCLQQIATKGEKFREKILEQAAHDPKVYRYSEKSMEDPTKRRNFTVAELRLNLETLISDAITTTK